MNVTPQSTPPAPTSTLATAQRSLLGVSAAILSTLLAVQVLGGAPPIGPRSGDSEARAGMVSSAGGHTVMTADGNNEDLLLVLDGRNEELFVYRTDANRGVQLFQRMSLPEVFNDARGRSLGR
jgi:hypothetical protein